MRTWTEEEIKFLRKAYNNESVGKLAALLGRSEQSIRNKVHILRKKGYTFDRVTDGTR
jgi:biotin operon repressor